MFVSLLASQKAIKRELAEFRKLAGPPADKPEAWYEKAYEVASKVTKYVGIPGLFIAAIGPVANLIDGVVESHNRQYVRNTYINYASELLSRGSIDRANHLLTIIEQQKDFDTHLQYYKAKTLIAMAIQQGRNYSEAYDTAQILTSIQENRDILFPSFGGADELIELRAALADIDIQEANYSGAQAVLHQMESDPNLGSSPALSPNLSYRRGEIDVLQFHFGDAERELRIAVIGARKLRLDLLAVNATFQLAKTLQFSADHKRALPLYQAALADYIKLGDQFGQLRTLNNIAMIYFDARDNEKARSYYNSSQALARQVGDQLGYARATTNLALIEKVEGNYDVSITLALDALGTYKQLGSQIGVQAASILLSNDFEATGDDAQAVSYARQALASAIVEKDLRAIYTSCGSLANIFSRLNDNRETVYSSLCAMVIIDQINAQFLPLAGRDYEVFERYLAEVKFRLGSVHFSQTVADAQKRLMTLFTSLNLGKNSLEQKINAALVAADK